MTNAVIVSACRTPIGRFNGGLSKFRAPELGAIAIEEAMKRSQLDPADVVLPIDDRPKRRAADSKVPLPPLGSLFEQAVLIVLDQVVLGLMSALDLTEEDMARIHTEFE